MLFQSFFLLLGGVILIDLLLSGDNALVIGAVAAPITPRRRRLIVLAFGGVLAIVLRIIFTISATFLLAIPYIQAIGGLTIAVIAFRLIPDALLEQREARNGHEEESVSTNDMSGPLPSAVQRLSNWSQRGTQQNAFSERRAFVMAVLTVTIADLTMSLDNILAIGALAHGNALVLIIGLSLSIVLLLISSAFVAELMNRIPKLILAASIILSWVAGDLIWNNLSVLPFFQNNQNDELYHFGLCFLVILVVHGLAAAYIFWRRRRSRIRRRQASSDTTPPSKEMRLLMQAQEPISRPGSR